MTADELRAIVEDEPEARRMSQQAWARALGVAPGTFRRWLAGATIPRPVALAVAYLQEHPEMREPHRAPPVMAKEPPPKPARHK
jgi:hypothetical protein